MPTANFFVQNGGTTSEDIGAASTNGVNMPLGSQTIADMNRTIFPIGVNSGRAGDSIGTASFGTHIKEAVAIVKDWVENK
jgi:hypothetical protein